MVNVTTKPTTKKKNPLLDKNNANNPIIAAATAGIDTGGVTQAQLDEAQRAGINVMSPKNVKLMSRLDKEALARQTAAEGAAQGTVDLMNSNFSGQNTVNPADINKPLIDKASQLGLAIPTAVGNAISNLIKPDSGVQTTEELSKTTFGKVLGTATLGAGVGATIGLSVAATAAIATAHVGVIGGFIGGFAGSEGLKAVKSLISSEDSVNIFKSANTDMANLLTAVNQGTVTPEEAVRQFNRIQDYTNDEVRAVKLVTTYNPVLWIDGGKKILITAQKTQEDLKFNKDNLMRIMANQAAQNAVNQLRQ